MKQVLSASLLRLAIHQTIYAKALYPYSTQDIDYDQLDTMINRHIRTIFNLPLQNSTIYYRSELGIWPSRFYAHRRALICA